MNIEKVYFEATDRLELVGLLHKGEVETKKVVISVHGMTSNCLKKRDDVIARKVCENGIDFFSFNNRGNGVQNYATKNLKNETKKVTVGTAYEDVQDSYYDICGAMLEMKKRGYTDIYLQGHSLGCTKIVYTHQRMLKEKDDLVNDIKGVLLLSLVDIPKSQKVYLGEKYEAVLNIAKRNESELVLKELMPKFAFIHPISTKSYLRYFRDNKDIDFARYSDENYDFKELNNIKVPLFMRWGNVYEMIEQEAPELVKLMNNKIKNEKKDINYIDGADHGYSEKYEVLASQILEFLKKV